MARERASVKANETTREDQWPKIEAGVPAAEVEESDEAVLREAVEGAGPAEAEAEEETEPESEADDGADPIALYLQEIGAFPLLTREGEIEVAKRKEEGETRIREEVYSSPLALRYVFELAEKVRRDELRIIDVLNLAEEDAAALDKQELYRAQFLRDIARIQRSARACAKLERARVPRIRRDYWEKSLQRKRR
jgi:RNA polymerase primary sigma factor